MALIELISVKVINMKRFFQRLSTNQTVISILGFAILFCAIGGYAFANDFNMVETSSDPEEAMSKVINVEGDIAGDITINLYNQDQAEASSLDETVGSALHNYRNTIFVNGLRAGSDRKQTINSDGDLNMGGLVFKSQVVDCTDATTTPFAIANPFDSGSATVLGLSYYQSGVATSAISIDIGVSSTAFATADNLIDGLAVATSTTAYEGNDYGTNGKGVKSIDTSEYIVGTITTVYEAGITNANNTYDCSVEVLFMQ